MSTAGSRANGGRYNPPSEFGALYTALEEETATAEVAKGLRRRGLEPSNYPAGAYWTYTLEIASEAVLDLTDPDVLGRLGIQSEALTAEDFALPRQIAREARLAGYQCLLAPSAARAGAKTLIVFLDQLSQPPRVRESRPVGFGSA